MEASDDNQGEGYDEITGGLTSEAFEQKVRALIESLDGSKKKPYLAIIAINSRDMRRVLRAPRMIDAVFRKINTELVNYCQRRVDIGRIQQDQLGVVFSGVTLDESLEVLRSLCLQLKALIKRNYADVVPDDISFNIGVCHMLHQNLSFQEYIDLIRAVSVDIEAEADSAVLTNEGGVDAPVQDSPELEMVLRAMNEGWLRLASQKIAPIDKPFEKTTMMEMLIRIAVPGGPIMISGQFMKTAEDHGLTIDLDQWVIKQVCKWLTPNNDDNGASASYIERVFVNLSPCSIQDRKMARYIDMLLDEYGINGSKICFEVNEADALKDMESFRRMVSRLRQIGCTFALDNVRHVDVKFNVLNRMPVNYLKLDGHIITEAMENDESLLALHNLVKTGESAGKRVIAQRVEDAKTISALRQVGVAYIQGFGVESPKAHSPDL